MVSICSFVEVFDAVSRVKFDKENITHIVNQKAGYKGVMDSETIRLSKPVSTNGNIEDWLGQLLKEMKRSMRREIRRVANDVDNGQTMEEIIVEQIKRISKKTELANIPCTNCKSLDLEIIEQDIIDYISLIGTKTGAKVEVISGKAEYGSMLASLGKIGALLRYNPNHS